MDEAPPISARVLGGLMLLVLVGLGWRVGGYFSWYEGLRQGREVVTEGVLYQGVEKRWHESRWNYRGMRVVCPVKVEGCNTIDPFSRVAGVVGVEVGEEGMWGVAQKQLVVKEIKAYEMEGWEKVWGGFGRGVERLRKRIMHYYEFYFSEPYSGLMSGIVLGEQVSLTQDLREALIVTGTLHVVAASGYNVVVVIGAVTGIFTYLVGYKKSVWLSMGAVVLYVFLAGASPPVIRAGLMWVALVAAGGVGREYIAWWWLVGASWLMLMAWPWMVVSVSFWLSVAATLGVMSVAPRLKQGLERRGLLRLGLGHERQEGKLKDGGEKRGMMTYFVSQVYILIDFIRTTARQDLATTLGATLMTMPIIVFLFERVSLISPLANVLLLWLIPPIMAVGSMVGLLGWFEPVARVLSLVGYPLVKLYVMGVEWLGSVPMAQVELAGIGWMAGWGWWLVIGGLVIKSGKRESK
jgi:ComEC/Rec2-related protein